MALEADVEVVVGWADGEEVPIGTEVDGMTPAGGKI